MVTGSTDHSGCLVAGGPGQLRTPHRPSRSAIGRPEGFFAVGSARDLPFGQRLHSVDQPAPAPPAPVPPPGIVAGTNVLTAAGLIRIEMLRPGDRIVTRNTGLVRLVGLSFCQYDGDFIAITARALGETRPETDTIVPAARTVLLRGSCAMAVTGQPAALVPAGTLSGLPGVTLHQDYEMTLVQLVFDTPQLVYADGLETLCHPDPGERRAA